MAVTTPSKWMIFIVNIDNNHVCPWLQHSAVKIPCNYIGHYNIHKLLFMCRPMSNFEDLPLANHAHFLFLGTASLLCGCMCMCVCVRLCICMCYGAAFHQVWVGLHLHRILCVLHVHHCCNMPVYVEERRCVVSKTKNSTTYSHVHIAMNEVVMPYLPEISNSKFLVSKEYILFFRAISEWGVFKGASEEQEKEDENESRQRGNNCFHNYNEHPDPSATHPLWKRLTAQKHFTALAPQTPGSDEWCLNLKLHRSLYKCGCMCSWLQQVFVPEKRTFNYYMTTFQDHNNM